MGYIFNNLIIDIDGLILDLDNRKKSIVQDILVNLLMDFEKNECKIFLVSTNKEARKILIDEIAEDIENNISIKIFDEKESKNSWDVWTSENNLKKENTLLIITSNKFIDFLKNSNLFSVFANYDFSNNNAEKLAKKTKYKKVIDISKFIDEIPNILFKLDSFLE